MVKLRITAKKTSSHYNRSRVSNSITPEYEATGLSIQPRCSIPTDYCILLYGHGLCLPAIEYSDVMPTAGQMRCHCYLWVSLLDSSGFRVSLCCLNGFWWVPWLSLLSCDMHGELVYTILHSVSGKINICLSPEPYCNQKRLVTSALWSCLPGLKSQFTRHVRNDQSSTGFSVHLKTMFQVSVSRIGSNYRMFVNAELKRTWKEMVVAY